MKRMLISAALAVVVLAVPQQRASAFWGVTVNIGCGIGLTIACAGFSIPCGPPPCAASYTPPALWDGAAAGGGYAGGSGGFGGYSGFDGHASLGGGYGSVAYYGPQGYPTPMPAAPAVQQAGYYGPAGYGYQAPSYWYGR
jgi:hypothetical protein